MTAILGAAPGRGERRTGRFRIWTVARFALGDLWKSRLALLLFIVALIPPLFFGGMIYLQLKNMPVHRSMLEISELIYATCKAYLFQQGKFLMILWVFIAAAMVAYYKFLVGSSVSDVAITWEQLQLW